MSDKRGHWSKKERDLIWKSYVDDKEYIFGLNPNSKNHNLQLAFFAER